MGQRTDLRIEGYAVVSDDHCIADANGELPDCLRNEAEWNFSQAGLDEADVTVLGRLSHDVTPNHRERRRLVLTRSVERVRRQDLIVFWNPQACAIDLALEAFELPVKHLAVAGGRDVFDFFLESDVRFTAFHLSRVRGTHLPDGVGVFSATQFEGRSPESLLEGRGYLPDDLRVLDEGVDVVSWRLAV